MKALPVTELPLIVDRLLVGALIEARSCERFKLLVNALPADCPSDLREFYEELFACEARHYRCYVDLATAAAGSSSAQVESRLLLLAEAEAEIVRSLAHRESRGSVHG
jgi:tRNA-(ms[2]io[6]A)-hydroxylase